MADVAAVAGVVVVVVTLMNGIGFVAVAGCNALDCCCWPTAAAVDRTFL